MDDLLRRKRQNPRERLARRLAEAMAAESEVVELLPQPRDASRFS